MTGTANKIYLFCHEFIRSSSGNFILKVLILFAVVSHFIYIE